MSDRLSMAFAALADPTRRDMVARLAIGEATVGELAAPHRMSLQAVSKHLKVLEQAGLVTKSRDGQRRRVRLESAALGELTSWIHSHQRQAEARMSRLEAVLAAPLESGPALEPGPPPESGLLPEIRSPGENLPGHEGGSIP